MAISFALYVAWDHVGLRIKRSSSYREAWKVHAGDGPALREDDRSSHYRRVVTVISLGSSAAVAILAYHADSWNRAPSLRWNIFVNALLWLILLSFRVFKELVTPTEAGSAAPTRRKGR